MSAVPADVGVAGLGSFQAKSKECGQKRPKASCSKLKRLPLHQLVIAMRMTAFLSEPATTLQVELAERSLARHQFYLRERALKNFVVARSWSVVWAKEHFGLEQLPFVENSPQRRSESFGDPRRGRER